MKEGKFILMAIAIIFMMSLWGCGSNRSSDGSQTAALTDEDIVRATSYVGSDRCGGCHAALHTGSGWSETAHTQKLRDGTKLVNYMNDGDVDGRADFLHGTDFDLATEASSTAKFAAFGANAPVLGSDSTGPYIKIGADTHYIVYTLGGSATQSLAVSDATASTAGVLGDGLILNDEAQWKQRYITKVGKSHYILPVQFNAKTQLYTTYHPEDWYDGSNVPLTARIKNQSYERRCAGCHVTGLQVKLDGDEWVMSFTDISVACEACHGPGGQHAASPNKSNIKNPATLTTTIDLNGDDVLDTKDNLLIRNYVCYHCHSRGAGKYTAGGTTLAYSSKNQVDSSGNVLLYIPGLDWTEYYDISTKATDYWGGDPTSGNFITSKGHHQQQQDHAAGAHGADKSYDHACFECHDLHNADKKHLVASQIIEDGIVIANTDDKNTTLCLACHATHGDFADLTPSDVNVGAANYGATVASHISKRAYMNINAATLASENIDCQDCHMPATAKSAIEGDVKSHQFRIIWPNYVMQPASFSWNGILPTPASSDTPTTKFQQWWESNEDVVDPGDGTDPFATVGLMPNSCMTSACHTPETDSTDILQQWYVSGHAHGTGEPFNHWNTDDELSSRCARCHSMLGFKQHVNGETITGQSNVFPKVLGCETCHVANGGGATIYEGDATQTPVVAPLVQTVTFPSGLTGDMGDSSNICMECHQGRQSGKSLDDEFAEAAAETPPRTTFSFINRHYFAAAAILFGSDANAGYEYAGKTYLDRNTFPNTDHGLATPPALDTCVKCHMRGTEDHNFVPKAADCNTGGCHTTVLTDNDFHLLGSPVGNIDYDGDTTGESFQGEIDGMEALLLTQMQTYATGTIGTAIGYNSGAYPYFFKDTDGSGVIEAGEASYGNRYNIFDETLLKAAFNYHSGQDPCNDMHNHKYAIQTIYDSIEDLGGSLVGLTRPVP